MIEPVYDVTKATEAQDEYCHINHAPHFAPYSGFCYKCGRNIYSPVETVVGAVRGFTVAYAREHLITHCPHCNYSFCE